MVPTIDNFFYDSFIAAVGEESQVHCYPVMIMQSRDKVQLETPNLYLFRKNSVMGVFAAISIETKDMTPFHKPEDLNIPVVFFDRVAAAEGYHKVGLADAESARIAAEAIIEKKKRRVLGLFGHPHLSIRKIRSASFKETFQKRSPKTKLVIDYPETIAKSEVPALAALKEKNRPDAVFCMGDMILMSVMHAVHKLKLKVPEGIGIIGLSNGLILILYDPKVTQVQTSGFKLGKPAFTQMLSCLRNQETAEEVIVESSLVEVTSL